MQSCQTWPEKRLCLLSCYDTWQNEAKNKSKCVIVISNESHARKGTIWLFFEAELACKVIDVSTVSLCLEIACDSEGGLEKFCWFWLLSVFACLHAGHRREGVSGTLLIWMKVQVRQCSHEKRCQWGTCHNAELLEHRWLEANMICELTVHALIVCEPIHEKQFMFVILFMNRFCCSPFVQELTHHEPILWTHWEPLLDTVEKAFTNVNPFVICEQEQKLWIDCFDARWKGSCLWAFLQLGTDQEKGCDLWTLSDSPGVLRIKIGRWSKFQWPPVVFEWTWKCHLIYSSMDTHHKYVLG